MSASSTETRPLAVVTGATGGIGRACVVDLARDHRLVVSVEDNGVVGGCGSVLLQMLSEARIATPVRVHGIPQRFLTHGPRAAILAEVGLTAQAISRSVVEDVSSLDDVDDALVEID